MKKTCAFNLASALILALAIAGCASSPDAEEQLVEEQSEDESMGGTDAALLDQIEEARRAAEESGARERFPDELAAADLAAGRARDLFNEGNDGAAVEEGHRALDWYQALKASMDSLALREKILEYGFDEEDPEGFADAEAKYAEARESFEASPEQASELSLQALAAYQAVCDGGFMRIAEEERARALEAREQCDSIRAERSMAGEYRAAARTFDSAAALGERLEWEDACRSYRDAAAMFAEVYQGALHKRNVADEAMRAARERQEASRELAVEADRIAPLPDENETPPEGAMGPLDPLSRVAGAGRHSIQY